jgi:hypothetical protein
VLVVAACVVVVEAASVLVVGTTVEVVIGSVVVVATVLVVAAADVVVAENKHRTTLCQCQIVVLHLLPDWLVLRSYPIQIDGSHDHRQPVSHRRLW